MYRLASGKSQKLSPLEKMAENHPGVSCPSMLYFVCRFETEGTQLPCKAVVNLSDLRIPLMWKDSDHFKNKGGKIVMSDLVNIH